MKPEKALLHGSTEPLHTAQPCFIRRQTCFIKRLFRRSSSISFRHEAFAFRKYEAQAPEDACIIRNFSDDPTPVKPTGFFVFSPTNYPQKTPLGVSGKLSATPNSCKVAHLLRFFGKYLCHLRFQTQRVTYCKSRLVYYNILGSFSQAAIHTRQKNKL